MKTGMFAKINRWVAAGVMVLAGSTAVAQENEFRSISNGFETFSQAPAEKIYLHTDKNFYLAGEIIWFKLYYVDAGTHQPNDLSKVCYVEILDRGNKPVMQGKIELTEKGGSGSFYLPLTLNSDNYILRAYTSWMKNAGAAAFFEKTIQIVNTIKTPEKKNPGTESATINFFPEGGNLVQDIETKLGFRVTDQNGRGLKASGFIMNGNGDTIQSFATLHYGIGSIAFRPRAGEQYKAMVNLVDGRPVSAPLPTVYESGYVMNVTDNKDGRLKVKIRARRTDASQRGEMVFLLAHARRSLKMAETGFVNYESDLVFYIDQLKLPAGITHLTLFNADKRPVCERLVFKRPAQNSTATMQVDKPAAGTREKITIALSSTNQNKPGAGNYSVSVYQLDSPGNMSEEDIRSYLLLSSDLRGNVESPGFYFSNEPGVDEATDNLLLTHGWRRFRWEQVLSGKPHAPLFIPEYGGQLMTVRITQVSDGKPAAGLNCFLSYPSTPFGFVVAKTDENGYAFFNAKDYYGAGEIIVQPGVENPANYRVDILTPFSEEGSQLQLPLLAITKDDAERLTRRSIAMQTQNIYSTDSIRRFLPPSLTDTFPFFGKAEYSYPLDEYKRFTTMEEVLREYVTPVNVAMRNGKLYMSIYDEASQTLYTDQMLVLMDGVPLVDPHKVFSYDPLKVKSLKVVPRRFMMGGMYFKGIASFETYQGRFDGFDLVPGIVAVDYEGLQLQREFFSPSYRNEADRQKRIPDARTTLYWQPNVDLDAGGKTSLNFYSSDQQGRFLVLLQGLDHNNEPVSVSAEFTVK